MNKKILYLISALLVFSANGFSQQISDAIRYSEKYAEGTARSVAMGNAVTALGGDMGAITINPASSGVYRYSEFIFTPSLNGFSNNTKYLGTEVNNNKVKIGVSNFGYIGSFETGRRKRGLINWSLGIVYNKQNSFNGKSRVSGVNNKNSWLDVQAQKTNGFYSEDLNLNETSSYNPYNSIPSDSWASILAWNTSLLELLPRSNNQYYGATSILDGNTPILGGALNQNLRTLSEGNRSETAINFGGNISNILYFGANLGIQSIYYKQNDFYSESVNKSSFANGFNNFSRTYTLETSGTGINLKAGIIIVPINGLRIGASISSPTWLFLTDEWTESMSSVFTDYNQSLMSPLGVFEYKLNTPFSYNFGLAYNFKNYFVISADYERIDYSYAKFKTRDNSFDQIFEDLNSQISNYITGQDIIRLGAEAMVTNQVALRVGYQSYSNYNIGENDNINRKKNFISAGVGYVSDSGLFLDLAYTQRINNKSYDYYLYNNSPVVDWKQNSWKLLFSIGIKF